MPKLCPRHGNGARDSSGQLVREKSNRGCVRFHSSPAIGSYKARKASSIQPQQTPAADQQSFIQPLQTPAADPQTPAAAVSLGAPAEPPVFGTARVPRQQSTIQNSPNGSGRMRFGFQGKLPVITHPFAPDSSLLTPNTTGFANAVRSLFGAPKTPTIGSEGKINVLISP